MNLEGHKVALDVRLADVGQRGRPPAWLVVLVDDHGAYAFIEIMSVNDAGHYAEFRAHARIEIPGPAAAHLRQRQFKTERRLSADGGSRLLRPIRVDPARDRFAIERGKNGLDHVPSEQTVDCGAVLHNHTLSRRFAERGQNRINRDGAGQAVEQRGKTSRGNPVRGNAAYDGIRNSEALSCQCAVGPEDRKSVV